MSSPSPCALSLGSNIEPVQHLSGAIQHLGLHSRFALTGLSKVWETEPWGGVPQDNFLNIVLVGFWQGEAKELLELCWELEREAKRIRQIKNGPRSLDVDVLLFGDLVSEDPELLLPHPGLTRRDFMLLPLLELWPQARHPATGILLEDLRKDLDAICILGQWNGDLYETT